MMVYAVFRKFYDCFVISVTLRLPLCLYYACIVQDDFDVHKRITYPTHSDKYLRIHNIMQVQNNTLYIMHSILFTCIGAYLLYWFQCSLRVPPSAKNWSRVIRIPRASAMCSNTVYATESMITVNNNYHKFRKQ